MEALTERRWTDDRMDDLKHQVDELGRRIEEGFAEQRKEMNARFDRMETYLETRFEQVDKRFEQVDKRFEQVDKRFEQVDKRFEKVEDRFERVDTQVSRTQEMVIGLHATMSRFSLTFVIAMVSLVAAQTGLILTQL
jgi:chromosome segregation ATPase